MIFSNLAAPVTRAAKQSGIFNFGPSPEEEEQRPGLLGRLGSGLANAGRNLTQERGGIGFSDRLMAAGMALQGDGRGAASFMGGLQEQQRARQAEEGEQNTLLKQQEREQQERQARRRTATERGYAPELVDLYTQDPEAFFELYSQNNEAANVGAGAMRLGGAFGPGATNETADIQTLRALQDDSGLAATDIARRNAGRTNVSVSTDMRQPDAFQARMAEAEADNFAGFLEQGPTAARNLQQIGQLESLLADIPTGAGASMRSFAGNLGIQTDGLSEIQAAEALINTLIPAQRPPGSGVMSDADLEMFRRSLPRLINSPEGNSLIIETMRSINQYDMQLANIAGAVASGELTREQARRAVNELQNPVDAVRTHLEGGNRDNVIREGTEAENDNGVRIVRRNGRWEPM